MGVGEGGVEGVVGSNVSYSLSEHGSIIKWYEQQNKYPLKILSLVGWTSREVVAKMIVRNIFYILSEDD